MLRKLLFALFTVLSIATSSAYSFQYEGLYYNILSGENRTVEVTYKDLSNYNKDYVSGDIEIPRTIKYNFNTYTVAAIGKQAFYCCSGLTSVTIPNSVTAIGNDAFCDCPRMTSVTIPNSVTSIGEGAFCNCSSLTSVTLPNSVISIRQSSFALCSSLTSVTIPNSVTSIGNSAFNGCYLLTSALSKMRHSAAAPNLLP